MGCIYRRGKHYWIKYYRNGKPLRESTHSDKKEVAKRLLDKREGEIAEGRWPGIHLERVTFDDLAKDFITDYRINKRKSVDRAELAVRHLSKVFGGVKAAHIDTAAIKAYTLGRMEAGMANASINRELAALKRMFRLAARCTPPKVGQVPYIQILREVNVRKGFFEHEDFLRLRDELPDYLQPVVTFAYHTGWRKAEILNLTWDKVDLALGLVRLDPGETKNDEGRTVFLNAELAAVMKARHKKRRLGCPYVFHNGGQQIKNFQDAWYRACKRMGLQVRSQKSGKPLPGKVFHDFRRTAVRNMVRAGVHERVAMAISGHKTRSVFDRYNIISEDDLKEAASKQERYLRLQNGYILGSPPNKKAPVKKGLFVSL